MLPPKEKQTYMGACPLYARSHAPNGVKKQTGRTSSLEFDINRDPTMGNTIWVPIQNFNDSMEWHGVDVIK